MARSGPAPKAVKHGHTGAEYVDVPDSPYAGPGSQRDLPDIQGLPWYEPTIGWWQIVRAMPHCRLWTESDWLFAIETAVLKNQLWGEMFGGAIPSALLTEIRHRENMLGLSMEARRKLGVRYVDPAAFPDEQPAVEAKPAGNVKDISKAPSRRARLAG